MLDKKIGVFKRCSIAWVAIAEDFGGQIAGGENIRWEKRVGFFNRLDIHHSFLSSHLATFLAM